MTIYVKVSAGKVVNRAVFDQLPADRPDWYASEEAQIGWSHDGSIFTPPPPEPLPPLTPKQIRDETFEALPESIGLAGKLRSATPAQIDSWLDSSVTDLASARRVLGTIIKYLTRFA